MLVGELSRHEGHGNENYTVFAIDHIEMCIVNLSSFIHHLEVATVSDEDQGTIRRYLSLLSDWKELMIIILRQWKSYHDNYHIGGRGSSSYSTSVTHTQRGRLRFQITRQLIECQRSIYFTWVQIAQIIGV